MSVRLEEIRSERGRVLLCVQGFKFYRDRMLSCGRTKWRCIQKCCRARISTEGEWGDRRVTSCVLEHTHPRPIIKSKYLMKLPPDEDTNPWTPDFASLLGNEQYLPYYLIEIVSLFRSTNVRGSDKRLK